MKKLFFGILLLFVLAGCDESIVRHNLKRISSHQITLPDSMLVVDSGAVHKISNEEISAPYLLMYIDSAECETCRINKLSAEKELFKMAEETGKFEVVILISPKRESQRKLPKYLAHLNYSFPVFIDEKNMFLEGNKFLPNSNRYHTMLTNGAGYPIFVGNPSWSESLNELFITIINNQL